PQDLFTAGHPVIFWSYDNFYHLARQNADLIRADAVIVNSAFEHSVLRRLCPGRVAAFAGHDVYKDHGGLADPGTVKDIDILHTGLSFTPLMLDKAQFLYRLATLDGADLEIQIHHGFLEEAQYRDVVTRAKMVPNILNRFHGGCPSRSLDALRAGSRVIHPGNFFADDLLGRAGRLVAHVEPATLEQDLIRYLSAETDYDDFQGARVDMEQTFWQSPVRESRFLKYCLFQTVLGEERRPGIPVAGAQTAASARCLSLFEMLLDTPLDESLRNKVGGIFKTSIQDFPDSLLLQFNHGRLLWLLEDRPAAREAFTQVLRLAEGGSFDPTQEDIRLQLYKPAQEMTPYQDYYAALAKDVRLGRADEAPTARRVIAATAHCYLGLDNLQSDQLEGGIEHLCQAMKLCARHFPAARLLVKALHVAGGEPKEVAAAFHDAVNLYPPNISELLPIGIQASEDAHGSEATLGLVRDWAYFITRVHWEKPGDHPIGEQTWQAAEAYFDRLPQPLAGRIRSRYDQRLA
ncbi:MAG: hypothetical protein QGF09_11795, partial [Rhodospirillales bacterium]|nr:hypothetical protein [Rhodospirillales bacterium]